MKLPSPVPMPISFPSLLLSHAVVLVLLAYKKPAYCPRLEAFSPFYISHILGFLFCNHHSFFLIAKHISRGSFCSQSATARERFLRTIYHILSRRPRRERKQIQALDALPKPLHVKGSETRLFPIPPSSLSFSLSLSLSLRPRESRNRKEKGENVSQSVQPLHQHGHSLQRCQLQLQHPAILPAALSALPTARLRRASRRPPGYPLRSP
jgi:hypothetical protein